MFAARNFVAPLARASVRPRAVSIPLHIRAASLRAHVAGVATVSEAIIRDHRELKDYYNEIVNSTDRDHQDRYGNQFVWELARHSIAEELIVYPAFEKYLGDKGKAMADSDRKEHHELKVHLKEFQNMDSSHPRYIPKIKTLYAVLEQHITEEEEDDLPKLERALNKEDGTSSGLAEDFERTKAFVPTRSHPSAGENPVFESVVGLMAAPIDRLADMFRKFPKDVKDPKDPRGPGDPKKYGP